MLVLTDPALADLYQIYDYIATDNVDLAERFILRFVDALHRFARAGISGVARDRLRDGLRMHPNKTYAVYFRLTERDFVVVRIVHGARDASALRFVPDTEH